MNKDKEPNMCGYCEKANLSGWHGLRIHWAKSKSCRNGKRVKNSFVYKKMYTEEQVASMLEEQKKEIVDSFPSYLIMCCKADGKFCGVVEGIKEWKNNLLK